MTSRRRRLAESLALPLLRAAERATRPLANYLLRREFEKTVRRARAVDEARRRRASPPN